ncbi:MAG: GAF domain-containing protein [Herpetosiphonaceae bacterium]|nr:GAF domain-containing protein [Herpetosiphonaceae bacterium]
MSLTKHTQSPKLDLPTARRLVAEQAVQFGALQRITSALTTTVDINSVLGLLLAEAVHSTGARSGTIALWHDQTQQFSFVLFEGYTDEQETALRAYALGSDDIPTSIVARGTQPLITHDGIDDVTAQGGSGVDVPVIFQGERTAGIISLRTPATHAFEQAQLPFLQLLAQQAALAIGNASYFHDQLRQRELAQQRAKLLNEVLDIGNAQRTNRPLADTLTDIAYGIVNAVGFRAVTFLLHDPDRPAELHYAAIAGVLPDDVVYLRAHPMSLAFFHKLLDRRYQMSKSFYLPESYMQEVMAAETDAPTVVTILEERAPDEWQPLEMLLTPLYDANEQLLGVLSVDDPFDHRRPHRRMIEALEIFANQAKVSIENAHLYRETQRQLAEQNALNQLNQAISGLLNIRQIVQEVFNGLHVVLDFDSFYSIAYYHSSTERGLAVSYDDGCWDSDDDVLIKSIQGLHLHLITNHRPLLIKDLRSPDAPLPPNVVPVTFGDHSRRSAAWIGVPLVDRSMLGSAHEAIGALSVHSYTAGAFNERDLHFLEAVGRQMELTLQNARLFQERERRLQETSILNQLAAKISAPMTLQQLAMVLHEHLSAALRTDSFYLAVYDPDSDLLEFPLSVDHGVIDTVETRRGLSGLVGYLMHTQQPLLLSGNIATELAARSIPVVQDGLMPQALLAVPLIVGPRSIGVISVQLYDQADNYSHQDLLLLQSIAAQTASGIEKSRLLAERERQVAEFKALSDIGKVTSSTLDIEQLFLAIYQEVARYRPIDAFLLTTFELTSYQITRMLIVDEGEAAFVNTVRPILPNSHTHHLIQSGEPVLLGSAEQGRGNPISKPDGPQTPIQSWAGVLLRNTSGEPFGVLAMQSYAVNAFDLRDIDFLTNVAGQVALNIQNARLFESEQAKRRLADTLREVSHSLTASLEIVEIYQLLLDQLVRIVPYDIALLLDHQQDRWKVVANRGLREQSVIQQLDGSPQMNLYLQQLLTTRLPMLIADTRAVAAVLPEHQAEHRSWLSVPLVLNNKVIGVIAVGSSMPHQYTNEQAQTIVTIANQAATAIGTATLFDTIRSFNSELEQKVAVRTAELTAEKERLEAVHSITTTLSSSLDSEQIILKSLELAAAAVGAHRGMVVVRDPLNDALVVRAFLNEEQGLQAVHQPLVVPGGGLPGWIIDHQQGVLIDDVREDARWIEMGGSPHTVRSVMATPLVAADVQLGVLLLTSRLIKAFTGEHLRLLATIASEIAIAMNNAKLYDLINDQASRLAEMLQVQRQETSTNRAILESVAEGVLVIDDHDAVVLYNPAAAEVLRIPSSVVYQRSLKHIAQYGPTAADHQRSLLLYAGLVEGVGLTYRDLRPQTLTLELTGQTIAATFAPVATPDGRRIGTAGVLRDITREIEADQSKRAFISTVSHELRTPLTSIKGYVDLVLLNTAGPVNDVQRSFLEVVRTNAERLNALVQDLLEISRLENGSVALNLAQISISELINDLLVSLRPQTEQKQMHMRLDIDPLLPLVEADGKRISQVLLNLLSNAHKYTFDGGTINIRARQRDALVQVDVQDTGVGITKEDLPKMFGRFFRTENPLKEVAGGTGLGLSIAKSFIELHHGVLWVESVEGEGSTFSFTLPLEQPTPDLEGAEEFQRLPLTMVEQ